MDTKNKFLREITQKDADFRFPSLGSGISHQKVNKRRKNELCTSKSWRSVDVNMFEENGDRLVKDIKIFKAK